MKTVFLGDQKHKDVIYEVVSHVREIENDCGAVDVTAPEQMKCDGQHLLSDALFNYKNSQAAKRLTEKQVAKKFVNDIRSHLTKLKVNTNQHAVSANDNNIEKYKEYMQAYLDELSFIQSELVDVPEWHDCRDRLIERLNTLQAYKYPSMNIIINFMQHLDRMNTSQAEKIHQAVDMLVKSYLSLLSAHEVKDEQAKKVENQLVQILKDYLTNDLNIDLSSLQEKNDNIIQLKMSNNKKAKAFSKMYGDMVVCFK